MGGIGKCCCPAVECVPCTEQEDLATWSVYEAFMGFVLSGTFGELDELNCRKSGCSCDREDNVFVAEVGATSPWSDWTFLYSCGTCLDCTDPDDPIDLPPCIDDIMTGEVVCPPGYPTYFIVEKQSRSAIREKMFYSKGVELCVTANYIGTDLIKFTAVLRYRVVGNSTGSFATKQRWRRREFECTSNRVIDSGTPSSDDSISAPEPLEPCNDVLGDIGTYCDPFVPPTAPDPCESVTSIAIEDADCEIITLDGCVNDPKSVNLDTYASRNCCDDSGGADLCGVSFDFGTVYYESDEYPCDDLPATIPMTAVLGYPESVTIGFFCVEGVTPPSDIFFTIPETLTLTVSI
jgi:hypothetical protein